MYPAGFKHGYRRSTCFGDVCASKKKMEKTKSADGEVCVFFKDGRFYTVRQSCMRNNSWAAWASNRPLTENELMQAFQGPNIYFAYGRTRRQAILRLEQQMPKLSKIRRLLNLARQFFRL